MRALQLVILTTVLALTSASAGALEPRAGVKLRALDKITGNSTDIVAKVGEAFSFGRLKVTVRACFQSPPEDTPESAAFLEIYATGAVARGGVSQPPEAAGLHRGAKPVGPGGLLFSGWMFASSPGLNALEHPTYDVWVISCSTSAGVNPAPAGSIQN